MPSCEQNRCSFVATPRRRPAFSRSGVPGPLSRCLFSIAFWSLCLAVVPSLAQGLPDLDDFARWQFIPRTYLPARFQNAAPLLFNSSDLKTISDQAGGRNLTPDQKSRLLNLVGLSLKDDWRKVVDETWSGPLPREQMLQIFDQFWDVADRKFACFHHLSVDWHALRDKYRPEVAAGASRGRFAAIMNHLSISLRESHTRTTDAFVNFQTRLLPGTPLMYIGGWGNDSHFGAGLTPLSDKSLLVYNSARDHPLGLKPGDIILGYGGIRWSDLYPVLLEAELPVTGSWWGSSPSAFEHSLLMGAGNNWHLFDTIDIRKWDNGEVLHWTTNPMRDLRTPVFATEQLPVPGVPMLTSADVSAQKYVSWGYIEGTQIAYVYVMGWSGNTVAGDLYRAVKSITENAGTKGLIIDFRTNYGGNMFLIDQTLPLLFKDRISTIGWAERANEYDHYALLDNPNGERYYDIIGNPNNHFDVPIAVLVGPGAVSSGDQNALRMKFHPRARLFGRSTSAAFNSPETLTTLSGWSMRYAPHDAYLVSHRSQYLTHEEFKVDFPVWLAPHDVAAGRDTVFAAAVEWINYANTGYGSCGEARWIPHVTPAGSGFTTRYYINNPSPDPAVIEIRPYDEKGNALAKQTAVVQGKGVHQFSAAELFPGLTVSHFSICGPADSRVTAVYRVETGVGPSASVHEKSDPGTEFVFYPEEWDRIAEGIAIVNPNSEPVKITASLVTREGVAMETVTLTEDLAPHAKHLSLVESFYPDYGDKALKLTASRPVHPLMLRLNQDATILYEVIGLKQK